MSRQAHLPPRCPFQKKPISRPIHNPIFPPQHDNDNESFPRHHKSSSQSSILEEPPLWLDDLISEPDSSSRGSFHRRSASDSVTLLDSLADSLASLTPLNTGDHSASNETGSGLETACIYGPNSPRQRENLTFSENAIVSALSEYAPENPLLYVDESLCISGITHLDSKGDGCSLVGELNAETKAARRHSGQRSRVRKLQYIAELERTVNELQILESELAIKVAALLQQRVALSIENSKLKQQVPRLQQRKLIMEGQYQSLKKEVERFKFGFTNSSTSKVRKYSWSSPAAETATSGTTCQMLDMGKLDLF